MAERYVNYAAVVANILRGPVDEDAAAEAEAGVNTLAFLEIRCEELDCDPGEAAHFAVLDLSALSAFGGVRDVEELVPWLREELPVRARELAKAVTAKVTSCRRVRALARPHRACGTELRRFAPGANVKQRIKTSLLAVFLRSRCSAPRWVGRLRTSNLLFSAATAQWR